MDIWEMRTAPPMADCLRASISTAREGKEGSLEPYADPSCKCSDIFEGVMLFKGQMNALIIRILKLCTQYQFQ